METLRHSPHSLIRIHWIEDLGLVCLFGDDRDLGELQTAMMDGNGIHEEHCCHSHWKKCCGAVDQSVQIQWDSQYLNSRHDEDPTSSHLLHRNYRKSLHLPVHPDIQSEFELLNALSGSSRIHAIRKVSMFHQNHFERPAAC